MSGGSKSAVYAAIGANALVTVAKFGGYLMTGSGALLAESVHSLADVGNQALLALGMKRAELPPDDVHPEGYRMEAFVWALVSAVGIFFVGAGVSVMHGITTLLSDHPHAIEGGNLAMGILIFSLVVEGASLGVAVWVLRGQARERNLSAMEHLRTSKDPFTVAVLLEDSAAVLGVLVALGSVWLTSYTHNANWDAYGTIVIGVLLGCVATFLVQKNKDLLVGRAMSPDARAALHAVLEGDPLVEGITSEQGVVMGAEAVRIRAEIDFDGGYLAKKYLEGRDLTELHGRVGTQEAFGGFLTEYADDLMDIVGVEIDRIEAKIRLAVPAAAHIDIEPD